MFFNLKPLPSFPLLIIMAISCFSLIILYSIGGGHFYPWCFNQLCRLAVGVIVLLAAYNIKLDIWKKYGYTFYLFCFIMLGAVAIVGKVSMGAQRWLNFGFFNFQPSELMRIFLVIVLAKYFSTHSVDENRKTKTLLVPIVLTLAPLGLVLLQPDLGTALLLFFVFCSILFVCGVQIWKFIAVLISIAISAPILWNNLHEYQRQRILMFISPEMDPNGAGYHIIQSQIALGSGGFWGKGLMQGSQSQLNFLPEKQTDFVFAALGEEMGFVGCIILLAFYGILLTYNLRVAMRVRSKFDQILVFGLNAMLFFYIFINVSMVCGLLPVVGIPLPFFSYGGSALSVLMFCQGIIFAADYEQRSKTSFKKRS